MKPRGTTRSRSAIPATLAAAWLAAVVSSAAAAAGSALEPPDLGRYLRWGPVRVRPGVDLSRIGRDDNILLRQDQRLADYTATIAPHVEGLVRFGSRAFLTFEERLEYTAYLKTTDLNFWNHRLDGRLTVPFGRAGLFVEGTWADLRERPVDREDIRPKRRERRAGAGAVFRLGWRTELELGRGRAGLRYTDDDDRAGDIGRRLDRTETTTSARATYRLAGRTRLTLHATDRDFRFERLSERDARERSWLPGIQLDIGGPLSGELRLGHSEVVARDRSLAPFRGFVGDARIAYRPNSRAHLRLRFERSQGFAVSAAQYYRSTEAGADATYYLTRVVGVELGGMRGRLTFDENAPAPRVDELTRFHAGIRLRLSENSLGRRVEYLVRATRHLRDSTLSGLNSRRTTFGIDAVLGF